MAADDHRDGADRAVSGTSADTRLKVVLLWHMHQPQYQDRVSGSYQLPWTYLHAIKDYTDMAAHLEAVPGARAVVNFAPILLEQIADYAAQLRGFLDDSGAIRDPLLAA
jgi:alpha-amylase/alpha-mannosidase (GH57 family)